MTVTKDDFDKIWASTSPLTPYEFSDSQYKQGWNFVGATPPSRQMWDAFMKNVDEKLKYLYNHEDVPVGFEYFTMNPNIPQGSLPLLGGEYSRETYADLWAWVQTQSGYLKTEAEWQTLSTANNGNVPFYSSGDGSTTFRVPSLHCWIKGSDGSAQLVGSYLAAGLPNITGSFAIVKRSGVADMVYDKKGVFTASATTTDSSNMIQQGTGSTQSQPIGFDASISNSIYGNSSTVQPESIVGMWVVKAYGTVTNVGSTDVANISTGLTQAETRISSLETNKVDKAGNAWVVEFYRNGTEWYRVWSDGWIEQGGIISSMPTGDSNNKTNYSTITLPKAFADTKYIVSVMVNSLTQTSALDTIVTLNEKNTTNFKTRNFDSGNALQVSASWFACGKGA